MLLSFVLAAAGHQLGGSERTATPAPAPSRVAATAPLPAELADLARGARLAASLADAPKAAKPAARPAPQKTAAKRATPARASRSTTRRPPARPAVRWSRPASGPLTSRYGQRWGRTHKGIDIGASYGSPIRAVGPGRVVSAGWSGGYGKLVTIRHADGVVTAYAHMSKIAVSGGTVRAGQVIGYVGSTGNSTGPHLHFEVRTSRGPVNPLPWLRARGIFY